MAESAIAIPSATTTAPATAVAQIRTFRVLNSAGALVEIQGVALLDEQGCAINAMSEDTGRVIAAALKSINNILVDVYNVGSRIDY